MTESSDILCSYNLEYKMKKRDLKGGMQNRLTNNFHLLL